jgi:hypothetical protein
MFVGKKQTFKKSLEFRINIDLNIREQGGTHEHKAKVETDSLHRR